MYCSTCGTAVAQHLTYCPRCGAQLSKAVDDSKPARAFQESLVWAMAVVFIVGLGATIGLMAMLKAYNFSDQAAGAFGIFSFALMLMLEMIFAWTLLGGRRNARRIVSTPSLDARATNELDAAPASALPAATPSITEQATRTFDPAYSERRAK